MSVTKTSRGGKQTLKRLDAMPVKLLSATVMALNDAADTLRTTVLRDIASEVNVKQRLLRERVKLTRANKGRLVARIFAKRKGLILSHFPNKQLRKKGKGVKQARAGVRVNVSGRATVLKSAFVLGSGGAQGLILMRRGGRVKALYGPSPSQILNSRKPEYEAKGDRIFRRELSRQLGRMDL